MNNEVISKASAPHYQWGDSCDSWVLVNTEALSVKQERMPPGTKENLNYHSKAQQFFFVLSGTASFYLEGEKKNVKQQEGLLVAENRKHYIANETTEELAFLVISQPSANNDRTTIE